MNVDSPADTPLSSALLNMAKSGMLVLEYSVIPTPLFRVRQANERMQQLQAGFPTQLVGITIGQLPAPFNSDYLVQQLLEVLHSGEKSIFQLIAPDAHTHFACELVRVEQHVLLLSVELVGQESVRRQLTEEVLETLPTGLVILQALRDETGAITDFQATFCNQIGADISRQPKEDILTRPISARYEDIQAYGLYHQYAHVITTGQPHHQLQYLPTRDIWLDISVVKFDDGVMVSFQDVSLGQKTSSLLESVLSSSPAAIRYYESIRDESGQLVDFLTSTGNELEAYRPYRPYQSTTGKRLLDLYPYLKTNGVFERYCAVVETGTSARFEVDYPTHDATVWFDCTVVRHGDGFVLTTLDITPRKQAQLAQQGQAHLLQTVLDNSLTGIARLKTVRDEAGLVTDFIIEKINVTLAHTMHRSPQEIEGQPVSALLPHQMNNGLFDRYAMVAQTAKAQRFEWANGTGSAWYDISAISFEDGLIITFLDITTIKLIQLDLKRQTELLAGVLDNSPNSILFLEGIENEQGQVVDFRIALTNPATLRMLPKIVGKQLTETDLLGRTLGEFMPANEVQETVTGLLAVISAGFPIRHQVDYPDLSLSYSYDITPFRNGALVITSDITPLRQYQQKLEENNEALSRSNEHLQQFAYVASHDLQEPLRKIQSFGNLLQSQYADQLGEGNDYLDRMQAAAGRMSILIKDLLTFSRISTHQDTAVPVPLTTLVSAVVNDLDLTIQETEAQITIDPLPIIQGDPTQLGQLFQNLLSNALKFRRTGNTPVIQISCQTISASQLPTAVKPALATATYYRIDVADNGIGFDEKFRDRIFQVFQRLHGKSEFAGTGVGLAICEKVAANHGGGITAHSQPGKGAIFSVFLPAAAI